MAAITIRDLDDDLKERLKKQAVENGVSMEAEARRILEMGVHPKTALEIWSECAPKGWEGINLDLPSRDDDRAVLEFDD